MAMKRPTYFLIAAAAVGATAAVVVGVRRGVFSSEQAVQAVPPPPSSARGLPAADGLVPPPYPVFPRGNDLTRSLPDDSPQVQQFLSFYTGVGKVTFPPIARTQLAALPSRYLDIADNGLNLGSGHFNSSLVCQSCHDSDWTVTGTDLPNMTFWGQPSVSTTGKTPSSLAANWSIFGDWSASIKALAGRDPVFLAQVEATRGLSPNQPAAIDNLCLRCHSPLGQRQAEQVHLPFNHYMLYSTPAGSGYTSPFPGEPLTGPRYAVYGALARDGVSCSACHGVSPSGGQPWNGTDYTVFYGSNDSTNVYGGSVTDRLKGRGEDVLPPPYPFTTSMNTVPGAVVGPDTGLNAHPMAAAGLSLQTALNAAGDHSYLRDSTVCGSCHIVILPKVPDKYSNTLKVKDAVARGGYEPPASCPPGQTTFTGDFLKDPCVGLAYEQTTYFEWMNSGYPPTSTCLTCHMQVTTPPLPYDGSTPIAQRNTDLALYYGDGPSPAPRQFNRHTLLGINLFVHEMFQQFTDVLGLEYYKPSDSLVPPYLQSPEVLQATPILVPNPGAEDGDANGWVASSNSTIQAVQQAQGAQGRVQPSHGKYFFQVSGSGTGAALTIDISKYATRIDSQDGAVSVLWGATAYCDRASCGALTLTPLAQGSTASGPVSTLTATPGETRWLPQQGTLALHTGTRSLSLQLGAVMVDDVFLSLRFPDGSVAPLKDGAKNYTLARNLLNAEQSILNLATNTAEGTFNASRPSALVSAGTPTVAGGNLNVDVTVTSSVGHKFPSGAGFRRAFLQLEVLDAAGKVLWASGQPNPQGAICNGACKPDNSNILPSEFTADITKLQPHYQVINNESQAQIYELRVVDDYNKVTSLELQQFREVKDNRILPRGWVAPAQRGSSEMLFGLSLKQLALLTQPSSMVPPSTSISSDPDYTTSPTTGKDHITYSIPVANISNWKSVRVRMNYQTIPPFYLNARFKEALIGSDNRPIAPGPARQRLIYMSSHLNTQTGLSFPPNPSAPSAQIDFVSNWTMVLSEATVTGS